MLRRWHVGFEVDAKPVGDAVDVIEVGDHLCGIMDGTIVEALIAERLHVGFGAVGGRAGQFVGVVAQGAVGIRQVGGLVILANCVGEFVIIGLRPEVFRVGDRSVMAVVGAGDDGGEHFALSTRKRRILEHS